MKASIVRWTHLRHQTKKSNPKTSVTLPGVHPGQVLEVHVGPDTRSVRHLGQLLHSLDVDPSRDSDVDASRHHGVPAKHLKHQS